MGNGGRIILRIEEFVIGFSDGGYRVTLCMVTSCYWAARVRDERYQCIRQEFYTIDSLQSWIGGEVTCIELFAFIALCRGTILPNFCGFRPLPAPFPLYVLVGTRPKRS